MAQCKKLPLHVATRALARAIASTAACTAACAAFLLAGCTFETRNKINRSIQNWTGTNGVVDVFSDGKVMYRFIDVEKLTTSEGEGGGGGGQARAYRYGYGVMDLNQNYREDAGEKKVYFEVSDYSTPYLFYENPNTAASP